MRGLRGYARARVDAATSEDVLVLLLEGAVERCRQADFAMEDGDRSLWNKHLHTVRAIFLELQMALDAEGDPSLITNLRNTYAWIIFHSTEAAKSGDRARLAEVLRVVEMMYGTWTQAIAIAREEADVAGGGGEP